MPSHVHLIISAKENNPELVLGKFKEFTSKKLVPRVVRSSDLTILRLLRRLRLSQIHYLRSMGLRGRNQFLEENCFFVTTTCYKWYTLLQMDSCKQIVSDSVNFLNNKYNAAVLGYVIMPYHLHLILYFKKGNQLSNWMRDLKKFTAVMIRQQIEKSGDLLLEKLRVPERKQVFKVWQDRFDDVYLASKTLLETKLDYSTLILCKSIGVL